VHKPTEPWIAKARRTCASAAELVDTDPDSAYVLAYDAARFARRRAPIAAARRRELGYEQGVEVLSVVAGSPADRGGIRLEDILVTVDGEPTPDVGELQRLMTDTRIGREVPVVVVRQERAVHLRVRPTELTVPR
jgi:S1-C subfamily serine protease